MANPIQRSVNFVKTIFRKQTVILFSESYLQKFKPSKNVVKLFLFGSASCVSCLVALRLSKSLTIPTVYAAKSSSSSNNEEEASSKIEVSSYREMRFRQFASIEYDGNIYMTPQDFLESLTEESPRARIGRTILTKSDVDSLLKNTPALSKGSGKLFRKLHDKGIISYTEYLFLLCVLTMSSQTGPVDKHPKNEPHSGFRIAFNMFDTDGNQIVDKKEFLVLFLRHNYKEGLMLEKVFSNGGSKQQKAAEEENQADGQSKKKAAGIQSHEVDIPDTTLLVHFFGKNGKNVLQYKDFHRFMENLQSEVIELEFLEFSKGFSTISEVAFAKILLRYTNLERGEVEDCLKRVKERMPNEKGISFDEFKKFCQFLNNLDDFAIAMKMYTFAQQPVSQEEFMRAVKVCTGFSLDPHIVATLFNIFDTDGDGNLSHKEFISLMKDRLHRGARTHLMHSQNKFEAFKTCVKNEMRTF
ncbi:calcium uptake protein 3, mitochondrial-like isoform X5 [Biomphalaria glabrata]|uniref:Calcium uptake protein 3, mitochondrial-like isoform X5 n=1 Tax=Biomphalaria glabrata TaxID=6526 RepID=A0A9W3B531_BIOGL|nr:calcium uptake protein 3, mitochondrial-like isoform X5 [Biomphalaria glabrata]